jgi:predicted GNAT family acetyltransferase
VSEPVTVAENPESERYEIHVDGALAGFTKYRRRGDTRIFIHTEIAPEFGGRGLGSELIRRTLDDVRARGLDIVPVCPFVKAFLDEHEDYRDLVRR